MLVVGDPAQAALEVDRVDGVKADQRREQPPVGLDGRGSEQVAAVGQALVKL